MLTHTHTHTHTQGHKIYSNGQETFKKFSQPDKSSGKFKLKPMFVITTYSLEWLRLKRTNNYKY